VIERLVYSYSDALWAAVLGRTIRVGECPLRVWIRKVGDMMFGLRELWEMGE
jgi:hypothetical protein